MKRLLLALTACSLVGCSGGTEEPKPPTGSNASNQQAPQSQPEKSGVQSPAQTPPETGASGQGDDEGDEGAGGTAEVPDELSPYVLSHTMNRIDGTPQSLEEYKGKVVLIVNTASKCGLTPQYEALQTLYDAYKDRGLVVLGFPANQFRDQEPGTNAEITAFCAQNYGVTFPMFEKTVVRGEGTCPLYQQLNALTAEPSWNFTKYLVNRQGDLVDRIDPQTSPTDPRLVARIESLLEG